MAAKDTGTAFVVDMEQRYRASAHHLIG